MATKAVSNCNSAGSSIAPSPTLGTYQAPLPFNSNSNSSTSSCSSPTASSLLLALRQFSKQPHNITDELNNLILKYIAATGDLPIVNAKDLLDLPKLPEFGQHIHKIMTTGFVRSKPLEPTNTNVPIASPSASKKLSQAYNLKLSDIETESEDDEDEYFIFAWKEDFMKHFTHDIKQHEARFTKVVEKVDHCRKVWKAIQSVLEMKLLNTIDEYNKLYGYDRMERQRCESRNCEYMSFTAFRKSIHKQFVTNFEEMPPFTLQRMCELLARPNLYYKNCAKLMRALEKSLRVRTFWQPIGIAELFEAADYIDSRDHSECASEVEDEDKGSIFNETASIHSLSKNSWTGRTMQSPRSSGSQSPYHHLPLETDSELSKAILADVGPGLAENVLGRVPSPQVMLHNSSTEDVKDEDVKNSSLNLPGPTEKRLSTDKAPPSSPPKRLKSDDKSIDECALEEENTLEPEDEKMDDDTSVSKENSNDNTDKSNDTIDDKMDK